MGNFARFLLNHLGLDPELLERLASEMGQESSSYTLDDSIEPGTYRIVHTKTNKVLQVHDENKQKLIIWDRRNQGSEHPGKGVGMSSRSTGVDAKLADLEWDFDDSE
jgi:hypothetical protein